MQLTGTFEKLVPTIGSLPEIAKTARPASSTLPTRNNHVQHWECKQRWWKLSGLKARLKLTPLQLSLLSLFLTNGWSLTLWSKWTICGCGLPTTNGLWTATPGFSQKPGSTATYPKVLKGRYVLWADRTADRGLCIYVNKTWCMDTTTIGYHYSANLEYLMVKCGSFYQPREFTSTVVTAAYIQLDADANVAIPDEVEWQI